MTETGDTGRVAGSIPAASTDSGHHQKQKWADRAEQLDEWAVAAEQKAAAIYASRPAYARDPAFLTQPARSSRGVARARQILNRREEKAWELEAKAKAFRTKAAELRRMASTNAGDAERARIDRREHLTATLAVGDLVESIYGVRRVVKINAKTLRLEGALGPVTIDKALCRRVAP